MGYWLATRGGKQSSQKKCIGILDGRCEYCGDFQRGFEMTKLAYFNRHNAIVLSRHNFLWLPRTFAPCICEGVDLGMDGLCVYIHIFNRTEQKIQIVPQSKPASGSAASQGDQKSEGRTWAHLAGCDAGAASLGRYGTWRGVGLVQSSWQWV